MLAGEANSGTVNSGDYLIYDGSTFAIIVNSDPNVYVKVTGDNMTGALTLGPDGGPAATTLATNGSGTFSGNVTLQNSVVRIESSRSNTTFKHINIENTVLGNPAVQGGSVFSVLASGTIRGHQSLLLWW